MGRDVVAIILFNEKKEILLQFRDENAPTDPLRWCFFGGGIEPGENKTRAILRETQEEICYKLKNPQPIYEGEHSEGGKIYVYSEKYDPSQKIELKEGKDFGWFRIEDIANLDLISYMKKIVFEVKDKLI